jgi:hypothetical protein
MGSEKAVKQIETHAKKRASGFMTILGVAADITAVAALVFNKDLAVFVQIASVAGVAIGVYLLLRQWGKPVGARVLFAVACIAAGCVVGAVSLVAGGQATSATNGNSSNSGGNTSVGLDGNVTTFQFRLEPYQGIDLDAGKHTQSDVVATDGPNGNVDIFMEQFGYLVVNNGSFYHDPGGPDSEVRSRCATILAVQRNPEPQVLPQKSQPACFKTSSGKKGWLRANDAAFTGQVYAVLNVQVWQ